MKRNTSWSKVSGWYNKSVGEKGNFYHQEVILENVLRLLKLESGDRVLDLGCGQGVLARVLPPIKEYLGIDIAMELIEEARKMTKSSNHRFAVADVSGKSLPIKYPGFNKVAIILALQNIKNQFAVIRNVEKYMSKDGRVVIVLNHPAFRIPKHADWEVDKEKNIQYRKVDKYMSHLEIPIDSSPFDHKNNQRTWSYHYPLSAYSEMLFDNGLAIEKIEEWVSPKKSEGGMAAVEDAARKEFPLFMTIVAKRL
jgi:ubiquinone/menaquinone biosynthesis C-methylase UbiE